MATVRIFFPKDATIKIDAAGTVTLSNSVNLATAGSSWSGAAVVEGQMKDITITLPVADVDKVDLIGTTSSYQNAEIVEGTAPLCEVSGTIVIPGDELMEGEIFGAGTSSASGRTYEAGLASRTKVQVLLDVDDGTDQVTFAIDNAYITQYDPTMNADGNWEASVTFKCLPRDTFGPRFKD